MGKLLYSIQTVAQMSGVSEHVIRAWERRYEFLTPARSKSGRRQYAEKDILKLQHARFLLQKGHTIGLLAPLSDREISELATKLGFQYAPLEIQSQAKQGTSEKFYLNLKKMNLMELDREITRARMTLPLGDFAIQVMGPLLQELGRLYASGEITISQEHMVSFLVRNHLGDLLNRVQTLAGWAEGRKSPKMILTTQEGNIHEFGILLSALIAGAREIPFQYLGPNMPVEEISRFSKESKPQILVLGSTMLPPKATRQSFKSYIEELDRALPRTMEIWIGGYCSFNVLDLPTRRSLRHVKSLEEFDQFLLGF